MISMFPLSIDIWGGGYTGSSLKVDQTLAALHKYGCPIQTMQEVQRVMAVGCPNYLVAEDIRSNFLDYYRYGNHITIAQNMSKVVKTMNKEDKHSYLMTLPSILARLIPDLKLTPQDLIIKPGKK